MMEGFLISRPVNSCLSHKDALQKCVEHAKLWLANSEQPIDPDSDITLEDSATEYDQEEEESENCDVNDIDNQEARPIEELKQEGSEVQSVSEPQAQGIPDTQVDENSKNMDLNVQQYSDRRPYNNNYRGGRGVRIYEQW